MWMSSALAVGGRGVVWLDGRRRSLRQRDRAIRSARRGRCRAESRACGCRRLGISATCGSCTRCGRGFPRSRPPRCWHGYGVDSANRLAHRLYRHRKRGRRLRCGGLLGRRFRQSAHRAAGADHQCGVLSDGRLLLWRADARALLFAVVWGFSIVADSAQFSALVSEYSPPTHVGTALTLQTCVGFLLTIASIRLLPWVASVIGWQWTFLVLVPGPVLGAVAMSRLVNRSSLITDRESRIPESSNR